MSKRIHALAQQLLGKSSVDDCTLEELEVLASQYPFFATAQFLLLQKRKASGAADYEAQRRKAVLYYHDPLQFDYFISSDKFLMDDSLLQQDETIELTEEGTGVDVVVPSENTVTVEQAFLGQAVAINTEPEQQPIAPVEAVPITTGSDDDEENLHFQQPDKVEEPNDIEIPEPSVLAFHPLHESPETIEATPEREEEPADQDFLQPEDEDPKRVDTANDIEAAPNTVAADETTSKAKLPGIVPEERVPTETTTAGSATTPGEPLAFEPYYTVDYFASQGIKATAEEAPKDKLSKQLRSFTDWLKMMKRLPAAEMEQQPHSTAEKTVEHLASHSVEASEVLTEAMAEVWSKQGAKDKAIDTYNKLSLLNPSKKAYFAAKIENLNRS